MAFGGADGAPPDAGRAGRRHELLVAFDDGHGLHMVIDPATSTTDRYDQIMLHLFGAWATDVDRA